MNFDDDGENTTGYPANFCSASNNCNDKSGFDHYNQWPTSKVIIMMKTIMIVLRTSVKSKAKSGLGGVAGSKAGNETRPINVRVVWIIKCW